MANHPDRIGQQVGDYRLLRWLGGGGFGDVYLAEQVQDRSQVAIKLLPIRLSRSEELKAFINEARTIRLKHAHIVPLLDFGISREEIPFLVMEYAARGTLRNCHPKGSQVPLAQVVNYAQQVASALQYAHEQRLIHRDVKPENMLLRADGTVFLSDFGLVAVAHSSPSLSPHQGMGGTVPYMAPEQIQKRARAASDQYSLGVVVYEWITGRCPFEGTATEIAMQHMMKPPPSLVAQVPGLPGAVEEVVLKALTKDPKDRFVTVQDFTVALAWAIQGVPAIPDVCKAPPLDNNETAVAPDTSILPVPPSYPSPTPGPRVDWGDALTVPIFYGREEEQALLAQWVVQEHYRVVSVLGMGGIGKSALVMSITHRLIEHFEVIIVRSLRDAPSCEVLLDDCLQSLGQAQGLHALVTIEQRISLLLSRLRKVRALVVLDNLEGLLEPGDVVGHFRRGFEGYGQLLHQVAETGHQGCLLLTSREKPAELRGLSSSYSQVRSLRLAGLGVAACKQLLEEKGVIGTEEEQARLIKGYAGNPLALKVVAETIADLFRGEIGPFLAEGTVVFSNITDLLDEQFARLSTLEQSMLRWLAIMREPVTLGELHTLLISPLPHAQVFEAVDSGYRRSLIECGKRPGSFTLQSVVLEYVTMLLIAETANEIQQHRLDKLIQYSLEQAHAKEYVRQTQQRLLVCQLLTELQNAYPGRDDGTARHVPVLLSLLDQLRKVADDAQGYGPANLIALLRALRGDLSGLDLSQLSIRGAYLQSIQMQDTSLVGSRICDTVFTEAASATWAVAISLDGKWWAASGMQGKVRIWDEKGQTLQRIWQAHTDMVEALAFSPDGRTLATGSMDGTIKLWDVETCSRAGTSHSPYDPSGALLWTGRQSSPQSLAFSPDGSLLASCGLEATVRLWDPQSGLNVQTLTHPGPVYAVVWSPDGQLLVSSCFDGEIRLWKRQNVSPVTGVEILLLQTIWVTSPAAHLAFAPDGRTLASANWNRTLSLWEVPSGCLLQTLPGQTDQTNSVVWSPDGRILVCSGYDKAIWLWDVEQRCHRAILLGHTADINGMALTPDGSYLLSGSADSTLRVWDVESGQCVRVIEGYVVSLYDIDWSPDSTHLVSGGTDGLVTIWDLNGRTPPRELHGHTWVVWGVGWSPDGVRVASCGRDAVIRLWDQNSGACVQIFQEPAIIFLGMAWSPDGSLLACGTYQRGMQVWDVAECHLRWVGPPHPTAFLRVAWSLDGTRLVGGGDDGSVYLWRGSDGTLLECLPGHHGRITSIAWSPKGMWLASGSGSEGRGELFVWDMQTCRGTGGHKGSAVRKSLPVKTFVGHAGTVSALAWSPSGDLLVSGGSDGLLRWWNVPNGESVSTRAAHQGTIRSLRVSPDGKWLASCGDDGAIMIWDLWSGEHLRTLRRDRPYERLNITRIRGLTEAQKASLLALGAIEAEVKS